LIDLECEKRDEFEKGLYGRAFSGDMFLFSPFTGGVVK
jgi:hypothetical protein